MKRCDALNRSWKNEDLHLFDVRFTSTSVTSTSNTSSTMALSRICATLLLLSFLVPLTSMSSMFSSLSFPEVHPLQSALNELLVKHMTPELCSSLIVDCEA